MPEDTCPVQWTGQQAVVTLPECIDRSNADQVREQSLLVINRGAAVLIADLAATVSCDYSGADALMRAYHRAGRAAPICGWWLALMSSAACSASAGLTA